MTPRFEVMQLIRLMYTSVASPGLSYDALTSILRTATAHNATNGITGVLCYTGSAFLQALEGHRSDVNRLYNRITRDTRHGASELLCFGEISAREFPDWSMKLIRCDGASTSERRALFLRYTDDETIAPRTMSAAQALMFLTEMAKLERAPRPPKRSTERRIKGAA